MAKYCPKMPREYEICPMDMLLVAATGLEVGPVITILEQTGFRRNGHQIVLAQTGVGQVATALALAEHLAQPARSFGAVVQAGIGGVFNGLYPLGSVVQVERDCFGDLGIEEKGRFTTLFEAGLAKADEKPYTDGWLVNRTDLLHKLPLPKVKAVTVNKVSDSPLQRQQLLDGFGPDVESMEGAAFHYACLRYGLPFVQLRGISNVVGERDKAQWDIKTAVDNLATAVLQLIDTL
jgi:futalosine hydrolase